MTGSGATAQIVDRGLVTHDVITGFEWLDLTVSTNLSYDQIAPQLGQPGGLFEQYRHASVAEVFELFGNAGIENVPFFEVEVSAQQIQTIRDLEDLLGVTDLDPLFNATVYSSSGIAGADLIGPNNVGAAFLSVTDFIPTAGMADHASAKDGGSNVPRSFGDSSFGHWLIKGQVSPGFAEATPLLPTSSNAATHSFENQDGLGQWFDPVAAEGFEYAITDASSKFTIVGLPTGTGDADGLFTVSDALNGTTVLSAGDFFTFPVAVDAFAITGIDPTVDGEDPTAFPTFLAFDSEMVSFSMTAISVSEPGTLWFALSGLCWVGLRGDRRGRPSR